MSDTKNEQKYLGKTSTEILVTNIKNYVNNASRNQVVFKDSVDGIEYLFEMRDGELVSYCKAVSIDITQLPNKVDYAIGDEIDFTGLVVSALCQDGNVRQVISCYNDITVLDVAGEIPVTLTYTEAGLDYTTMFTVIVVDPNAGNESDNEVESDEEPTADNQDVLDKQNAHEEQLDSDEEISTEEVAL